MSGIYSQPKTVSSDIRSGFDRIITYADGQTRKLGNFYLPSLINPFAWAGGIYPFGTAADPDWSASNAPSQKYLIDDIREGNDRVAKYSDGSSLTAEGWFTKNPQYTVNPMPSYTPPGSPEISTGFVPPSDITLPGNISQVTPTTITGPVLSSSVVTPLPTVNLPVAPGTNHTPQGPTQDYSPPGVVGLNTGLGNLTPGVANVPSTGPEGGNNGMVILAGVLIALLVLFR